MMMNEAFSHFSAIYDGQPLSAYPMTARTETADSTTTTDIQA